MSPIDKDFFQELRKEYIPEAEEYIQTLVSGLLELEKNPSSSPQRVEELFRAAHSLKGASQAVMLPGISSVCQVVESVFSRIKNGVLELECEGYDVLQRATDVLARMVSSLDESNGEEIEGLVREIEALLPAVSAPSGDAKQRAAGKPVVPRERTARPAVETVSTVEPKQSKVSGGDTEVQPVKPQPQTVEQSRGAVHDTVRVAASKLDSLLLKTQELLTVNLVLSVRIEDVHELIGLESELEREWEHALSLLRRDGKGEERTSVKLSEFFRTGRKCLRKMREKLRTMENSLRADQRLVSGVTNDLMEDARTAAMLPFSSLLSSFPKIVRDLARDLRKEAGVTIHGDSIEVDKRILEGVKDPLIHLVRNSVDHGLERPEERQAAGKPPVGSVTISISQTDGGRVEVFVRDDGKGLNPEVLRQKAVRLGLLSSDEAELIDDASALELIFRSGFSTSSTVTGVSGRGLGMAIVREGVEALGGKISIDSKPGRGTSFRLTLPLALATLRGVLVEEWGKMFVIPSSNLKRVGRVEVSEIKRIGRKESIVIEDAPVGLTRLGHILELQEPAVLEQREMISYVVIEFGKACGALAVDRIVDEREILLKPLGRQLARVRNVSGATVLGSGRVVSVLNTADIIRSLRRTGDRGRVLSEIEEEKSLKVVLVVEDSITSRTLLRNILSAAGFDVRTAADGVEAWEHLTLGGIDAVVSDVEMPRMNGLELTAKIRSDPATADLPVLLVTSLESDEDRDKGAKAGADSYVVKSAFDHENLLEALHRLL